MLVDNADAIETLEIRGRANPTTYPDARAMAQENANVLRRLSLERAQYIRNILVLCGFPAEKMVAIGDGGLPPFEADPSNRAENWKNRRVRFVVHPRNNP
jgi:outer membrane protein OmpA-like peptidoglycan-associated protein